MMLYKTLQILADQLNDYLKRLFSLREDIVFLSPIKDDNKVFPANRVSIMLSGLMRETAGGINFSQKSLSVQHVKQTAPPWQINVNLILAVIFQDKQYEDSLQLLGMILSFIQKNPMIRSTDHAHEFAIEPVNLSIQEMANLWGICGGSYYPSIMCRLRLLTVDHEEIRQVFPILSESELSTAPENHPTLS